jgi:hypothetical protein
VHLRAEGAIAEGRGSATGQDDQCSDEPDGGDEKNERHVVSLTRVFDVAIGS